MEQIKLLKVGGDFEMFLQELGTDEVVSAEGFVKGTKDEPFVFDDSDPFYATSLDNVLAEFCIPPSSSAEEFYMGITKSMEYLKSTIPPHLCLAALPSARLDEKWLKTMNAKIFGCEPDYNAYTNGKNQSPRPHANPSLRGAGGHFHLSYEGAESYNNFFYTGDETRSRIIKALDLFMAVPSVLSEPENERRKLYGKAGAFRPKPYGVEYRTLSNWFLDDKDKIIWAYNSVEKAIDWLNSGGKISNQMGSMIANVINTGNKKGAEKIVNKLKLETI